MLCITKLDKQILDGLDVLLRNLFEFDTYYMQVNLMMFWIAAALNVFPAPWKRFLLHTVMSEVHFYWSLMVPY
jgi:hypothetical protein